MGNYFVNGIEVSSEELNRVMNDSSIKVIYEDSMHMRTIKNDEVNTFHETLVQHGIIKEDYHPEVFKAAPIIDPIPVSDIKEETELKGQVPEKPGARITITDSVEPKESL
jgi:hypothetical protein